MTERKDPVNNQLQELKTHLREVADLRAAAAVLRWDQTTYMPPGGAAARGRLVWYSGVIPVGPATPIQDQKVRLAPPMTTWNCKTNHRNDKTCAGCGGNCKNTVG